MPNYDAQTNYKDKWVETYSTNEELLNEIRANIQIKENAFKHFVENMVN